MQNNIATALKLVVLMKGILTEKKTIYNFTEKTILNFGPFET
jgi:hypothetical protein